MVGTEAFHFYFPEWKCRCKEHTTISSW